MKITGIDSSFSITPQISPQDLNDIKAEGFRSVICNRPDSEDGGAHASHELMESEARKLGLEFAYLPVVPGQINDDHIAQFKTLIDTLPAPVLGYCRMGMRAKALYGRSR
jgi:sulfide:quinone oxidoreductase